MATTRTSYLIGRCDRVLRAELEQQLSDSLLSLNELTALSVLATRPGLSNADLARRALVTPQAMHKVVRSLEEADLIERGPSANGGRSLETTVTRRGHTELTAADGQISQAEDAFLAPLDANERSELRRLLLKLARVDLDVDDVATATPPTISETRHS